MPAKTVGEWAWMLGVGAVILIAGIYGHIPLAWVLGGVMTAVALTAIVAISVARSIRADREQ